MSFLHKVLEAIPSHKENPISQMELVRKIANQSTRDEKTCELAIQCVLDYLTLFELIENNNNLIKIAGQMQNYLRINLTWYLQHSKSIVSNWDRSGTAKEVSASNLLDQAPYFLKAIEERRRHIAKTEDLPLPETRIQPCAVTLIKIEDLGESYYLHQWDQKAERYQLIGGKQRGNETPAKAASRELLEEVSGQSLVEGIDFTLQQVLSGPIETSNISRTYGALTKYKIHVFSAKIHKAQLTLSEVDRWISVAEMKELKTKNGSPIAELGKLISERHPDMLESLPISLKNNGPLTNNKHLQIRISSTESTSAKLDISLPDKVTCAWLWKHVPVNAWWVLGGAVLTLASVSGGVAYQLGTIQGKSNIQQAQSTSVSEKSITHKEIQPATSSIPKIDNLNSQKGL